VAGPAGGRTRSRLTARRLQGNSPGHPRTGAPSDPLGTPTVATGSTPKGIAVDPLSQYAYATNHDSGTVSQHTIGASGALTPIGTLGYAPVQVSPTFIATIR
jgi:DNA-binding beta-propeller fold protein YncE